ncbi:SGNH/GDSL hydrolase family protein [Streptacidiphilus sp. P02-A3a]|uniref:SGNH/GDSL hydrolase family protein n=1 Tax=Streptacidiphilus sp. P02-A3a TaxID=2704468 RepID=UPI0015FA66BB|nr:SGNH/GDSL hydrolase family protein [Streptacidiphilus sp. P02-A3a]QMU67157.1 SGNH/GDSL hydrolase family protein [Streptacidiphilus sp. P02-A3a]
MIELSDEPMTWVLTGDSITHGVLHTHGERSWAEHVHERIRWQLNRLTDLVINTGVSGWRAPSLLGAYERHIGQFQPDVLSLSLGTNDARAGLDGLGEFRDSMRALIGKGQAAGAQVIVQTPLLVSTGGQSDRPEMPAYCQAVRELAAETGALLVDHEAHWLVRFPDADPIAWLDDLIHPNAVGHRQMADHLLRTIGLGELSPL